MYLDARYGFELVHARISEIQRLAVAYSKDSPRSIEEFDKEVLYISETDPALPGARAEHAATMGRFKQRNSPGEINHIFLGAMVLVSLYAFWESHLRQAIAEKLGMKRDDLKVTVFGDMRHLRRAILHRGMVAGPEIARCETLKWFSPGDRINITGDQIDQMIEEIRIFARSIQATPSV